MKAPKIEGHEASKSSGLEFRLQAVQCLALIRPPEGGTPNEEVVRRLWSAPTCRRFQSGDGFSAALVPCNVRRSASSVKGFALKTRCSSSNVSGLSLKISGLSVSASHWHVRPSR